MERVTFLVEDSNERLSCMLNPETVVIRRTAGVRPRESLSGLINTDRKGDNPLLFTGLGLTTVELDLVFDVSISGSSIESQDVRDLTRPIWDLSENHQRSDRLYRPAICRFIWGKCWNIPGVISAVAERLESFSSQGIPRRSWLRLRMLRMQEQLHSPLEQDELWSTVGPTQANSGWFDGLNMSGAVDFDMGMPSDLNDPTPDVLGYSNGRIDLSAYQLTGESSRWREVAIKLSLLNPFEWLDTLSPQGYDSSETNDSQSSETNDSQ